MDYFTLGMLGRILLGGYFIMMGINHFMKMDMMSGYASSKGVPSPKLAVAITGLMLILGGAGVLSYMYLTWSLWILVAFLFFVSFKMHAFWKEEDPTTKMTEMQNFLKNMALLGALILLL